MASIATYDFSLIHGDTFNTVFTIKDSNGAAIDLTTYTATMQIRSMNGSAVKSLTVGSGITITGNLGKIAATISAADSKLLPVGRMNWQLQIENYGTVRTIIGGSFTTTEDLCQIP